MQEMIIHARGDIDDESIQDAALVFDSTFDQSCIVPYGEVKKRNQKISRKFKAVQCKVVQSKVMQSNNTRTAPN